MKESIIRSLKSNGQAGNRLAKSPPEEPDAGNLHVRVCEGLGRKRPSLLGKHSLTLLAALLLAPQVALPAETAFFSAPDRGFVSGEPAQIGKAKGWEQGLLTGNGTIGALVPGNPYDETLYLSHASLFLPMPQSPTPMVMSSRLETIRKLCLAGDYAGAGAQITEAKKECKYGVGRDPFIGALVLHIKQPEGKVSRYQRAVDFMTAEASVAVEDEQGGFRRSAFASRADDMIVLRLSGGGGQSAEFSFGGLPTTTTHEQNVIKRYIESTDVGLKDGFLYFRNLFKNTNDYNPNIGYEGVGKVVSIGGQRTETATGISITGAKEILVFVKIRPLLKEKGNKVGVKTNVAELEKELNAVKPDYAALLASQARLQGDMMGRVSLSLEAPAAERAKTSEQLNEDSVTQTAPLAKIERAFDAGRYNIICSTGFYPPNLMGLWSGTWSAPWCGSFTVDGNLPCAVSFLLMGNTPELMHSVFRYCDERWPGFRDDAKEFYGMRGFHVPAQLTVSPKVTDFSDQFPLNFWHSGAAWMLQYYYDYFLYTGDRKFLAERAYPLMKEAAAFYEDFLTVKDTKGKLVFVPSYSPENQPIIRKLPGAVSALPTKSPVTINATMDVSAAKQLLRHAIASAKLLGCDEELQKKWADLITRLPDYEVDPEGSFCEWLWPGLMNNEKHRHASHLYPLFDEMPAEIVENPALIKAVEKTIRAHLDFRAESDKRASMAFGYVQLGLAAEHVGNSALTQEVINILATGFWSSGMASFHDKGELFNMDISGGFPYLCASALVYADPGHVRFFPARPPQWQRGSLRGVRLRGGITVRDLAWEGSGAKATLVSDTDQTVSIQWPDGKPKSLTLRAGAPTVVEQVIKDSPASQKTIPKTGISS